MGQHEVETACTENDRHTWLEMRYNGVYFDPNEAGKHYYCHQLELEISKSINSQMNHYHLSELYRASKVSSSHHTILGNYVTKHSQACLDLMPAISKLWGRRNYVH